MQGHAQRARLEDIAARGGVEAGRVLLVEESLRSKTSEERQRVGGGRGRMENGREIVPTQFLTLLTVCLVVPVARLLIIMLDVSLMVTAFRSGKRAKKRKTAVSFAGNKKSQKSSSTSGGKHSSPRTEGLKDDVARDEDALRRIYSDGPIHRIGEGAVLDV